MNGSNSIGVMGLGMLAAAVVAVPDAAAESTRDYIVQAGDSCLAIASRELGDSKKLSAIHRLNPGLGKSPHVLKAGQVLRLPVEARNADAELTTPRGQVEVRKPGNAEWTAGATGQDLFRSWRVGTRSNSSANILFNDSSTIEMREDTVVVIFGASSTTRKATRTTLERGALRSRLALLDGTPRLMVETPAGTAELTNGSSVIDVDPTGETKVANHTGKAAKLAGKRGRAVVIRAGFGSKVAPGKVPDAPTPLPPAPNWLEREALMLGWKGDTIAVRGEWAPVATASKYRIEIIRTNATEVIEARIEVPASVHRIDASNLPVEDYSITVAAVDDKGLEGLASPPYRVRIVELENPSSLVIGAEVATPAGVDCFAGGVAPNPPHPRLRLSRDDDGHGRITCAIGRATSTLEFELAAAEVAAVVAAPQLRAGETVTVDLAVTGVESSVLRVTGRGGVEVLSTEAIPGGVRLSLTAPAATTDGSVVVAVADAMQEVATIAVVVDAIPVALAKPEVKPVVITATGLIGTTGRRSGGNATWLGAELAVDLTPWLAPHLTVGKLFDSSASLGPGYLLGVTFKIPGPVRPLARFGASFENDRIGEHLGVGLEVEISRSLAMRANLDAIVDREEFRVHAAVGLASRY